MLVFWVYITIAHCMYGVAMQQPDCAPCKCAVRGGGLSARCTRLSLTDVPKYIPANITALLLNHNKITTITANTFSRFTNLSFLSISNNQLKSIPGNAFAGNLKLELLFLSNNQLESIPVNATAALSNLETLYLDNNQIKSIPENAFAALSNVDSLALSGNQLQSLPPGVFSPLSKLTHLFLEENQFKSIPENAFAGNLKLNTLTVNTNQLSSIHQQTFANNKMMKTLWLNDNKLNSLPKGVFDAISTKLEDLNLEKNNLASIDNTIGNLKALKELKLGNNKLDSLPKGIFASMTNLETLQLNNNQLSSIHPMAFGNNKRLMFLFLNNNKLDSLPKGVFASLTNLKRLQLSDNNLNSLPDGVFASMANVTFMWLHRNKLDSLPKGVFDSTTNLKILSLRNNNLTSIDKMVFGNLKKLTSLSLSNNMLTSINKGVFSQNVKLEYLPLFNNMLTSISENMFSENINLNYLSLHENKIKTIDQNAFVTLLNLTHLRLENNLIEMVHTNTFINNTKLQYLNMRNNKIICSCDFITMLFNIAKKCPTTYATCIYKKQNIEYYYTSCATLQGYEKLHCWKDDAKNHAIPTLENLDPVNLNGSYLTRFNAISQCYKATMAKMYQYFGVQNGGQCFSGPFAGSTYKTFGKSTTCRKDGKGGPLANEVYKISNPCIKTVGGTAKGACCRFPFTYKQRNYTSCINIDRTNNKLWCATTRIFGNDKMWGYCPAIWSEWVSWQPCTKTCSNGTQQRKRYCADVSKTCVKSDGSERGKIEIQSRKCFLLACPAPPPYNKPLPDIPTGDIKSTTFKVQVIEFSNTNGAITKYDIIVVEVNASQSFPSTDPNKYTNKDIKDHKDGLYIAGRISDRSKFGKEFTVGKDSMRKRRTLGTPDNKPLKVNTTYGVFIRGYITDDGYQTSAWYKPVKTKMTQTPKPITKLRKIIAGWAIAVIVIVILAVIVLAVVVYKRCYKGKQRSGSGRINEHMDNPSDQNIKMLH